MPDLKLANNEEKPRSLKDRIFDEIVDVFFEGRRGSPKQCRRIGNVANELFLKGVKPEEIRVRKDRWYDKWPGFDCTPEKLDFHWSQFAEPAKPKSGVEAEKGKYK